MTNTDKNRADFEAWLPPYDPLPIIKERMLEAYRAGREAERAESVNHNHLLERVAAVEKELSAKYSGNSVHDMLRQWYTNTVPGRPTLNILRLTRVITEYIKERAEAVTDVEAVYQVKAIFNGYPDTYWRDVDLVEYRQAQGHNSSHRALYTRQPKPEPSPDVEVAIDERALEDARKAYVSITGTPCGDMRRSIALYLAALSKPEGK